MLVFPTPKEIEVFSGLVGPKEMFKELLIKLWHPAKGMLDVLKIPLEEVAKRVALYCFTNSIEGQGVQDLKEQLKNLEINGSFDFEISQGFYFWKAHSFNIYKIPAFIPVYKAAHYIHPDNLLRFRRQPLKGFRVIFKGLVEGEVIADVKTGENGDLYLQSKNAIHFISFIEDSEQGGRWAVTASIKNDIVGQLEIG